MRFYTEELGFVETFRTPLGGRPDHVEVRLDGLVLGFACIEAARTVHRLGVDTGPKREEGVLWTDDVDATFDQLVARGASVINCPHYFEVDIVGRLRVAWVANPDGGAVQLAASPFAAITGS